MNKTHIEDLAVLGGPPAFDRKLHVGAPNLGDRRRFLERVEDILDRRWLSNAGCYVQEFERRVATLAGVEHCVATCNGTIALEIAIRALGLTGQVIVPSFTFVATAHALQWQEITPVFCDIDPSTCNLDVSKVAELITPRTTGIIGVHLFGRACDTTALEDLARAHNLKVLYDASHAFGCSHAGRMIGSFGAAEVFSFHATKFVNALEGGAIVTNDEELATKARLMKNFGFAGYDNVIHVGTNGKMNEISAAMGLTSLESMETFVATNRAHFLEYDSGLRDIPGLTLLRYDERERCNYQYVIVVVDAERTRISRDDVIRILQAENVLARRYFYPGCHKMEPYRSHFPHAHLLLPETQRLAASVLALPTGNAINVEDVSAICQILRFAVSHSQEITARLS